MNNEYIEKELELLNDKPVALNLHLYGKVLYTIFGTLSFQYDNDNGLIFASVANDDNEISFSASDVKYIDKNIPSDWPIVADISLKDNL